MCVCVCLCLCVCVGGGGAVRQLSADCKRAYDSVRREGLCNVLTVWCPCDPGKDNTGVLQ
jgi:hypothetical protein